MHPNLSGSGDANPEIAGQLCHREVVRDDRFQLPVFEFLDLASFETCGVLRTVLNIPLVLRAFRQSVEDLSGPIAHTSTPRG